MKAKQVIDKAFLTDFLRTIDDAAEQLLQVSEADAARPIAPSKWSRKEIIGHLVDSASNNHGRFVRGQLEDDMMFTSYDQDAWVRVQQYGGCNWEHLVRLWHVYNQHIAHIMQSVNRDALGRPRSRHNLNEIAFGSIAANEPATLAFLIRDYVTHMKHHLHQALTNNR